MANVPTSDSELKLLIQDMLTFVRSTSRTNDFYTGLTLADSLHSQIILNDKRLADLNALKQRVENIEV